MLQQDLHGATILRHPRHLPHTQTSISETSIRKDVARECLEKISWYWLCRVSVHIAFFLPWVLSYDDFLTDEVSEIKSFHDEVIAISLVAGRRGGAGKSVVALEEAVRLTGKHRRVDSHPHLNAGRHPQRSTTSYLPCCRTAVIRLYLGRGRELEWVLVVPWDQQCRAARYVSLLIRATRLHLLSGLPRPRGPVQPGAAKPTWLHRDDSALFAKKFTKVQAVLNV